MPKFPSITNTFFPLLIRPITNFWGKLLVKTFEILYIRGFLRFRPFHILLIFKWFYSFLDLPQLIPCKRLTIHSLLMSHPYMSETYRRIVYYVQSTYFSCYLPRLAISLCKVNTTVLAESFAFYFLFSCTWHSGLNVHITYQFQR